MHFDGGYASIPAPQSGVFSHALQDVRQLVGYNYRRIVLQSPSFGSEEEYSIQVVIFRLALLILNTVLSESHFIHL